MPSGWESVALALIVVLSAGYALMWKVIVKLQADLDECRMGRAEEKSQLVAMATTVNLQKERLDVLERADAEERKALLTVTEQVKQMGGMKRESDSQIIKPVIEKPSPGEL